MAHQTLAMVRRVFNWHATRSDEFKSPLVRGMGRIKSAERVRSRILNDDELRAVWKAAETLPGPFPAFVRFLLLTGARRAEAAAMPWTEIDGTDWVLPPARNKAMAQREPQDLVRPLSQAAQAIIAGQPHICDFVFSAGRRPLSSISRFKAQFDAACGVAGWTLHDLRRTARSLLSRAGVNSDHGERCLGHVIPGIRATYDRHDFKAEMAHAYEQLAAQIERIVHPVENVVTFEAITRLTAHGATRVC